MIDPLLRAYRASADPTPDAELLRRFGESRDDAAFELLVRRHADLVWKVCRSVLGNDCHAAEDAFQATFLALARKASTVRRADTLSGWLFQVARNAALHARRQVTGKPLEPLPDEVPAGDRTPDAEAIAAERAAILTEEVGRLPARFREPIVLCFFNHHTTADAAERLGWAVGTVASRLARAKDRLRSELARRGVALSAATLTAALSGSLASAVPPESIRACVAAAAGRARASGSVVQLTEGVLSAMPTMNKQLTAVVATLLFGMAGGGAFLAVSGGQEPGAARAPGTAPVNQAAAGPGRRQVIEALEERAQSLAGLRKVASAVMAYQFDKGYLPTDILGKGGKPLLSWRVAILPYMEQGPLYKLFRLDEPWDSPGNYRAASVTVKALATGTMVPGPYAYTRVKRFTGPNTLHDPGQRIDVTGTPDGSENTVLLAEVGDPVPWAAPADPAVVPAGPDRPFTPKEPPAWNGPFPDVVNVVFANGEAVPLKADLRPETVASLIYRNDGAVLPDRGDLVGFAPLAEQQKELDALLEATRSRADELIKLLEAEAKLRIELAKQGQKRADVTGPLAARLLETDTELRALRKQVQQLRAQLQDKK